MGISQLGEGSHSHTVVERGGEILGASYPHQFTTPTHKPLTSSHMTTFLSMFTFRINSFNI
jgi:hypothetical protein